MSMGEFSADWLALREPADHAARSAALTRRVADRLAGSGPVRILDLATGTGSNVRYLAPHLGSVQHWRLVDRDRALLEQVPQRVASWGMSRGGIVSGNRTGFSLRGPDFDWRIETRCADLSTLADPQLFQDRTLVTASALLDLVSERWLQLLAERCRHAGATVLFALTYDGRMACAPAEPDDELVRELVNRHQRRSKGFGRALGPDAGDAAIRCFDAAGYEMARGASDWQLPPSQGELQRRLIEGWAQAAAELESRQAERLEAWKQRRVEHVGAGTSQVTVGHVDLAGWPRR
jgi:hypothetical protein